jgi:hypothetical protein
MSARPTTGEATTDRPEALATVVRLLDAVRVAQHEHAEALVRLEESVAALDERLADVAERVSDLHRDALDARYQRVVGGGA